MSLTAPPPARTMTAEELMALPDDGVDRELIRGELRERPMTRRNWRHSDVEAEIVYLLRGWLQNQPPLRGRVTCGEAGFRLRAEPATLVGVDVAYASAEVVAKLNTSFPYYDGPPVLAVEIMSPSDKHQDIVEKVSEYLAVGTVVWVVDPDFRTVTVYRPGQPPEMLNDQQELTAEPELPGFRVPVAKIFGE
jgi:Uma2 family endonuclease